MKQREKWKKNVLLAIFGVIICLFGIYSYFYICSSSRMGITLKFDALNEADSANLKMCAADGTDYSFDTYVNEEAYIQNELQFIIEDSIEDIEEIILTINTVDSGCNIKSMELSNHGVISKKIAPANMQSLFSASCSSELIAPILRYEGNGNPVELIATQGFLDIYNELYFDNSSLLMNVAFFTFVLCIVMGILIYHAEKVLGVIESIINRVKNTLAWLQDNYCSVLNILLIIAGVLVFIMAVKSKLYAHPDETVTKYAIDYYLGSWLKPGLNSSWTVGTFSNYGVSRLDEASFYYLFAGKIGWLFKELVGITTYYRMLNVCMFWVMVILAVRYGNTNKWMYAILLFTPQLWYVFSYATSDAWDFFWSFVVLFLLAKEGSPITKWLNEQGRIIRWCVLGIGLPFAFILQGKTNYYLVLLLAFMIFLEKLLKSKPEERKVLFLKYVAILVCCFGIVLLKAGVDWWSTRQDTTAIWDGDIQEINADYEFKDSNFDKNLNNTQLIKKGVSFKELMIDRKLVELLVKSFIGGYGWMDYFGSNQFVMIMGILYLTLLGGVIAHIVKKRNCANYCWLALDTFLCMVSVGLVVYFCWFSDFQPQGRYVLPALLALGHLYTKDDRFLSTRLQKLALVGCFMASVYSFVFVGMRHLL